MTIKFQDFGLKPDLLKGILDVGYEAPTPIQAETIPLLLEGKDVIGCAQTGTGKTAAFSLPILQKLDGTSENPRALILTPTRELADQIHKSIVDYSKYLATKTVVIYGGASSRFQEHNLQKGADILVATPGRLLDFLEKRIIRLYDVKFFVLDEADRMLDMGFIPDIEEIQSYIPRGRQTLLFSATMPPEIEKLARKMTQNADLIDAGTRSSTAENVTQIVYKLSKRDKFKLLLDLLEQDKLSSVIVFCSTKIGTTRLARDLIRRGVAATPIHSNLTQTQRERSLQGFRAGEYSVLVATDVAARGIDISDVSHVINYDTPMHPEDYVHRIGRTGRASATGDAITFTTPEESKYLKRIEELIGNQLIIAVPQKSLHSEHDDHDSEDQFHSEEQYRPEEPRKKTRASSRPVARAPRTEDRPKQRRGREAKAERTQPKQAKPQELKQESPAPKREERPKSTPKAKSAPQARPEQPKPVEKVPFKPLEFPDAIHNFVQPSESLDLPKAMVMAETNNQTATSKRKKWNDQRKPVSQSRTRFKHPLNKQQRPLASAHSAFFFDHPDDIDYLDED